MFPGQVGTGVARLTVRNAGAIALAVKADTNCGFSSDLVNSSPKVEGEPGSYGTVTWRVEGCVIDLPEDTPLSEDCSGTIESAVGKVTVTAEKQISGRITGDPEQPVIPADAEAVTLSFTEVQFEEFSARSSASTPYLVMSYGSLSFDLQPMLARSSDTQVCSAESRNVRFDNIRYGQSRLRLYAAQDDFDVDVQASDFRAALGVFPGQEDRVANELAGTVTLWGRHQEVPLGDSGLDPEFDEEAFIEAGSCLSGLVQPLSYSCGMEDTLGSAASRLSVLTFGSLLRLIDENEQCGFASPQSRASYTQEASGSATGTVDFDVTNCTLQFPEPTVLWTDCLGNTTSLEGTVHIEANKTIEGWLTGDPDSPIVPTGLAPALVSIRADLNDFAVHRSNSDSALTFKSGFLQGSVSPQLMRDDSSGVCMVTTPNAEFHEIVVSQADLLLTTGETRIGFQVDQAELHAVNGVADEGENHLEGRISVDGVTLAVPTEGRLLDPDYDPTEFQATYTCVEGTSVPQSPEDCNFEATLARAASRLLVASFATTVEAIDRDADCGFDRDPDQLWSLLDESEQVTGGLAQAVWDTQMCVAGEAGGEVALYDNCLGGTETLRGVAQVSATKEVSGEVVLSSEHLLQPRTRESAHFFVEGMELEEFATFEVDGEGSIGDHLVFHQANLQGELHPVTAEAESDPGGYFIPTPVSRIEVSTEGALVTLRSEAKSFPLVLDFVDLTAFNGSYNGDRNWIAGQIWVNGNQYVLGTDEGEVTLPLDPNFDQSLFDARYECRQNLLEPVPAW
ncbi:MAG: hypothetical protein VX498_15985 [Myxococcota bacterium]|nr:hypothetical protein [Myxococcota bacterium]